MTSSKQSASAKGGWVTSDVYLKEKSVLITGGNSGIGFETAVDLARREATVIIACRDESKGENAVTEIRNITGSKTVFFKHLDLSSFQNIRKFAKEFIDTETRLDILINNAGIMLCPQSTTEDGFETHFGVNHLGHFLLTNLLMDLLKKSSPSRIITLSSVMHTELYNAYIHWDDLNLKKSYFPRDAYSQSKLMNVLFSRELSKRLTGTGVTTYCVHPGLVRTNLLRHVGTNSSCWDFLFSFVTKTTRRFWKTPEHGAQTSIYCAIAPEIENVSGKYYVDCHEETEARQGRDDDAAKRLWEITQEIISSVNIDEKD